MFNMFKKKDTPLPFQAKIGSRVSVQSSVFISADISGSLFDTETEFGNIITSMSSVLFDGMDTKAYRYYTNNGDQGAEAFVEFLPDTNQYMICKKLFRHYPETIEEQDMYLGKCSPDGLGAEFYSLDKSQLIDLGYSEEKILQLFGESDTLEYVRDIDNTKEFVKPLHGYETRIDDQTGINGMEQEIFYMPYVRDLQNGLKEFLLISTEVVKSLNGNDGNCLEIHVDFMIGILISQDKIEIQ